ncbi:hypothetical protein GCM10008983_04310 [Lentibacillus halophilus]|uniref:Serine aminopeptidase S33 domain-containing protein n=1 Tax=Lentibacillus halophilus TaxID=295065 RepID=A0ABN0Z3M5_9BACI
MQEAKGIIGNIKQGENVQNMSQELKSVFRPSIQEFLASWMHCSPSEEVAELDMPILLIGGGCDLQVPSSETELLHTAQPDADIMVLEKMNHVLKEAPTDEKGNQETYGDPDRLLADGLVDGIVDFLKGNGFTG